MEYNAAIKTILQDGCPWVTRFCSAEEAGSQSLICDVIIIWLKIPVHR